MTFTFRLEQADGTPADPPTIESTVTNWRVGETIPIGRDRSLRVVGIVVSNEDEPVGYRNSVLALTAALGWWLDSLPLP
jgi:hypothetical protein